MRVRILLFNPALLLPWSFLARQDAFPCVPLASSALCLERSGRCDTKETGQWSCAETAHGMGQLQSLQLLA